MATFHRLSASLLSRFYSKVSVAIITEVVFVVVMKWKLSKRRTYPEWVLALASLGHSFWAHTPGAMQKEVLQYYKLKCATSEGSDHPAQSYQSIHRPHEASVDPLLSPRQLLLVHIFNKLYRYTTS